MSKTTFSDKCEILGSLWSWYKNTDNDTWKEFFVWADIGLPLAYMAWQDLATVKADGKDSINEVWDIFCEMIDIDPELKYSNLEEAFAASDHASVEG